MEVIRIHHPMDPTLIPAGPIVLAMGFFDGVHRGHQAVIKRARQIAEQRQVPLAVLTYDHSPSVVYQRYPGGFKYLTTTKRKLALLDQLGVQRVYLVSFTSSFASLDPQSFVDQYLVNFHAQVVVAGFDHTYGKPEIASMDYLPKYAHGRFQVVTVPKLTDDDSNTKIGSQMIRQAIDEGKIQAANHALGYFYQTSGLVVHGLARGRTLGFPTINVETPMEERVPAIGVYAVRVTIGNQTYDGMASVGHNITFGPADLTVEIYLFDFDQMVYGEEVTVQWLQYLRGEVKFADANALIAQMKQDERHSRRILENIDKNELGSDFQ